MDAKASVILRFRKKHWPADFASDGKLAVAGGKDGMLTLWDLSEHTKERQKRSVGRHTGPVTAIALSQDGKVALSGGQNGTLKLWDVEAARELRSFARRGKSIASVAISPDASRALSRSEDGTMTLWDMATGRKLRRFATAPYHPKERLEFDGERATIRRGWSGTAVWDVSTGSEVDLSPSMPPRTP